MEQQKQRLQTQVTLNKKFCREMALICLAAGIYLQWKHKTGAHYFWGLAAIFILMYLLRPMLANGIRLLWEFIGKQMSKVSSVAVLCLAYLLVITPMAIVFKLIGRNLLEMSFDPKKKSYWKEPAVHYSMKNQY
ncbi:hypothetical protein SNE25_08540 [Mucilaginibacter sabulilitoris]|uniref:SxtJ n=1 Tax=Mucilaginibacter sabulilitoris TaxID=1173583 RepID=A0ABZ0TUV5_9SPHI|nr:hypothetical protein [Mucilaginibacter sabulilitoris]WPU95569.1 hypothetical protein SNE25_08540 [Mucilaginibacter sabulilitoris]